MGSEWRVSLKGSSTQLGRMDKSKDLTYSKRTTVNTTALYIC